MSNHFSSTSSRRLSTCDPQLQELFYHVLDAHDCTIIDGHRDKQAQDLYYAEGMSKLKFPKSKHNSYPSKAVDVAPYPIDWNDTKRFYYFAGIVKAMAHMLEMDVRWGGDWDSDNDLNDQNFMDLVHWEIK